MILENQLSAEDYAVIHFQNTLVDYHINIEPLPTQHQTITLGVRLARSDNLGY